MPKDGIVLLREDHRTVEGLFKRFEKLGPSAHKSKRGLVDTMIEELSRHAAIEEQILYPAARETMEEEHPVLEALEEHQVVKWLLHELEGLEPSDERFDAKVTVMMELVRHHVQEEESELFPALREAMGRRRLRELGEMMAQAKPNAPTKPHPRKPSEPSRSVLAGVASGAAERVIDLTKDTARRVSRRT